ncbi:hypothetical protein COOONC_07066, partial [Cooperia oncophora]
LYNFERSIPPHNDVPDRFQLDAQVQHKLDFVKEHLPKAQKIYILGHSIGAYMMLRILPYVKDDFNIRKAIGLFPTVEKMADSPNGVRLKRVLAVRLFVFFSFHGTSFCTDPNYFGLAPDKCHSLVIRSGAFSAPPPQKQTSFFWDTIP